jgi:hypothetical protein
MCTLCSKIWGSLKPIVFHYHRSYYLTLVINFSLVILRGGASSSVAQDPPPPLSLSLSHLSSQASQTCSMAYCKHVICYAIHVIVNVKNIFKRVQNNNRLPFLAFFRKTEADEKISMMMACHPPRRKSVFKNGWFMCGINMWFKKFFYSYIGLSHKNNILRKITVLHFNWCSTEIERDIMLRMGWPILKWGSMIMHIKITIMETCLYLYVIKLLP